MLLKAYDTSSGLIEYPSALMAPKSLMNLSALFTEFSSPFRSTLFPLIDASIWRDSSMTLRHLSSHP